MKSTGKRIFLGFLLFGMWGFSGCATQGDLDAVQRDSNSLTKEFLGLQRNLYDLNAELKEVAAKLDSLDKRTGNLQRDVGAMSGEMKTKMGLMEKEMESSSQPMRRYQADLGARIDKLQLEVQNLTGRFEESKYFAEKTFGATKNYQARLEELEKQVAVLSKSLGSVEKKPEALAKPSTELEKFIPPFQKAEEGKPPAVGPAPEATKETPVPKAEVAKKPVAGPDEAYKKAYELYSKGRIDEAQKEFKKFLEVYPKSKYAENSHFWLGECYFSQKKYEDAILEFDEVIKKFPKGNKVPDALYRQGMAFLEMKDTTNAKLILKEVLRRFPQSDQANRARKKLQEIG
jgi:tol-pal system protein YbgF